jgi:predicted ATP-grasp superfamily ATP-dependent carboligase
MFKSFEDRTTPQQTDIYNPVYVNLINSLTILEVLTEQLFKQISTIKATIKGLERDEGAE